MRIGILNHQEKKTQPVDKEKVALLATFVFVVYTVACIIIYLEVNEKLEEGNLNDEYKKWQENYYKACGKEMDMTKSLQNAVLLSGGYFAFGYGTYVSTLYRSIILRYSSVPIQDYKTLRVSESTIGQIILKVLLRIFVLSLTATVLILPILFLKGTPILNLFSNVMIPLLLMSLYMVTIYDKIIYALQERFSSWND